MDKLVCVYAGDGAVLARDVEVALDKLEMPPYHIPNARTIGLFVWHNIKLRA